MQNLAGFALAALDLFFFQRWLNNLSNPAMTISIMDAHQVLLARKPSSNRLGERVEDAQLAGFLHSGDRAMRFRHASPVDQIDRLWSIRRTHRLMHELRRAGGLGQEAASCVVSEQVE